MRQLELQILNSALLDKEHLFKMLQYEPEIFSYYDLLIVRNVMSSLAEKEQIIDLPALSSELFSNPPKGVQINQLLAELSKLGKCHNIDFNLKKLHEHHIKNKIKDHAVDLISALKRGDLNYDEIIDQIINTKNDNAEKDEFCDLMEYVNNTDLDDIFKSMRYIKTNIRPIDDKLYGFYAGQLIIIAARPAKGKTTLALEIAEKINEPLLFFSLEMTRQEIYAKILSARCEVEAWKILFNKLDDLERERILKMHEHLKTKFKIILFDGALNISKLVYYINHFIMLKQPRLVVIDYLQLIGGAKGENQNIRIGIISRTMKLLAMKHKIPIILLSQLSREIEKTTREPKLSDLRDSGSIEQDANIVIFLHESDEKGNEIIIAKNKMGPTGKIYGLKFEKQFSRFIDIGG